MKARGRMGEWANGRMGEWANGRMGEWANGRMGEWTNGRMGETGETAVCADRSCRLVGRKTRRAGRAVSA
jgi:hypothetical protein